MPLLLPYTEWSLLRGVVALVVGGAMGQLVQTAATGATPWRASAMAVCGLTAAWYALRWCGMMNRVLHRQLRDDDPSSQARGHRPQVGRATSGLRRRLASRRERV